MSGWIKFDKDMPDDPRVMEIAASLRDVLHLRVVVLHGRSGEDLPTSTEVTALRHVTVGALVTLWRYAHDHIRADDTLKMGLDTLDAVVGIDGFCALLPEDWLVELEDGTTKLPGYCAKNGLIGKEKRAADNAARQAAWRARHKNERQAGGVTHNADSNAVSNVVTSNDVTRPDLDLEVDLDKKKPKRGNGSTRESEAIPVHDSLPLATWEEWMGHRRKRHWPMDSTTLTKQLNVLKTFDTETQRTMIDQAINAGWQGIFPPKGAVKKPFKPPPTTLEIEEREAKALGITIEQLRIQQGVAR